MYPVQVMISYFTTSFTVIMHIGREVTAKQYTGGGTEGPLYVSVIREFTCLRCGKHVRVTDGRDCRTKFCSQHCEKLYWKHSKKYLR